MKGTTGLISILSITGLLGATILFAQPGPHSRGGGQADQYGRLYNPQTVQTITGEVVKVERVSPMHGMGHGVHLLVKTGAETLPVHLGPSWFIDNQELQIQPTDQVQVTGSRVELEGKPVLLASQVKDGSAVLKLRDESGIPVWAGWRHGGAALAPGGMVMGGGGMNTNRMERRKEMMAEHQKMMAEMKRMDAELDQKVAEMNQAQGSAKLDAMAAAINDLVNERKVMHEHMAQMLGRRMSHMHPGPGAMGGSEAGPTGGSSGSGGGPNQP
jgi:hypothetical protein